MTDILEQNTDWIFYQPWKTKVSVSTINETGHKSFYFKGLVTQVTTRGLMVAALEEPHGQNLSVEASSFVPFNRYGGKFQISIIK
jgi:hypothetical protein